jgi:tetratricopeptide (TPR) repeat protein
MKSLHTAFLLPGIFLSISALAQQTAPAVADLRSTTRETAADLETPAEQRIAGAQLQIKADPGKVQAYNELALAFLRRARETADSKYLREAGDAVAQGLKLEPGNFQLQKAQVALMLARHEYAQAAEQAKVLNHHTPDDVMTYGYIAEAEIGLGNYPEAVTNAQWMMNMRPRNTPALLMGAQLRSLYGDAHGAIDFLQLAYSQTSPAETEDLAWIANQIASIQIESGQADAAARTLATAEQIFPHDPYTTENLARVRRSQLRPDEAVQLWKQAAQADKDPHLLYELAAAEQAAGQQGGARSTLAEFEKLANSPGTATDSSRLDLILMYSGSPVTAAAALKLAQEEIAARHDVWTLDAYAVALYANARYRDADEAEQKVLAIGIQSAQIFDHAGLIAKKLNRAADAARYFKLAVQANPESEFAADALKASGITASVPDLRDPLAAPNQSDASQPESSQPAPNSPQVAVARNVPAISNGTNQTSASAADQKTNTAFAFVPVPQSLLTPQPTETAQVIRNAQETVKLNQKDAGGYARLGAAYFQNARETGDVSDYQRAEEALAKSLDIVSEDFSSDEALGTLAEVCMGEHRFPEALAYAQKALSLGTGDVSPFAIAGDAYADMGEYDKAASAYAKLTPRDMTLSPRAAYARDSRFAYLKFVAGDTGAAIGLMKTAVSEGVEAQLPRENMAWLYYELGEFSAQAGDVAAADAAYLAALTTHPGDYRALAALAKLRANNGRYAEAIVLYQKAIAVVPMPIFIAELGDLYARTGNREEAQKQYALVEYIGLLGSINQVLHNRDLALFYADHDIKLTEALRLAQKELELRHDIYTWDALAWALYKNGRTTEAAEASEKALKFGTRDSLLLFHAGMIAEKLGQREKALSELKEALEINPHFHLVYARAASENAASLESQLEAMGGSNDIVR